MSIWQRSTRPDRLLLSVVLALLVAACGTGEDTAGQAGDPTTTVAPATVQDDSGGAVSVADSPLGERLVDPNGWTLYVFTQDEAGESTCYDACANDWPPVPADVPLGDVDESLFGSVARTDGPDQLTVAGQPVYLFAGDSTPGDVEGQGVNGVWFVVAPDGSTITKTESRGGYDYDY